MLNIYTITKALYDQIRKDDTVVSNGYKVSHSEFINMDPDRTPWIGVYKGPIDYNPKTLGRHSQSWDAAISLVVIVQASHGDDSVECSRLLGEYEATVLDAIWSDATLDNNIDMITGFNIEYSYNNTKSESLYHQQSIITITAEASTG